MGIRIKYPDPYGYEEQPKFDGLYNDLSSIKGKNDEQDRVNIKQDAEIANLDETNKKQDVEIENKKITVEQEGNLFTFYQGGEKIASIYQEEGSGSTVVGGELSDDGNTLTIIKDSGSNINIDISQLINEVELNAVVNAINTNIVGVTNNLQQEITDANTTLNVVKNTADDAKRIADTAYLNDKYTRELVDKNTADIAKTSGDTEAKIEDAVNDLIDVISAGDKANEDAINEVKEDLQNNYMNSEATTNFISGTVDTMIASKGYISNESFNNEIKPSLDEKYASKEELHQEVAEGIAKVVADAPEDLDTLKEVADYIASDKTKASEIEVAIAKNAEDIENLSTKVTEEYAEKKSVEELISMLQSDIY